MPRRHRGRGSLMCLDNSPILRLLHPTSDSRCGNKPRWLLLCNTVQQRLLLVVRLVRARTPSNALSLSAALHSLTFAAVGRAFPHDVWALLCDSGPPRYSSALKLKRPGISARNPRSPSNLRRHPSASFAASSLQARQPACLERGEATGIRGSSHAAAATLTYIPSVLLYLIITFALV